MLSPYCDCDYNLPRLLSILIELFMQQLSFSLHCFITIIIIVCLINSKAEDSLYVCVGMDGFVVNLVISEKLNTSLSE